MRAILRKEWRVALAIAAWASFSAAGFAAVWRYKTTPGARDATPLQWPARSALPRSASGLTLVIFLHPKCECTRATLDELEQIAEGAPGLTVIAAFERPEGAGRGFTDGPLWKRAAEIRGVQPVIDDGGGEARLFGALTSGHALLYGAGGELLYSGGITGARGHGGANPGEASLRHSLADQKRHGDRSVFGCALRSDT